MKITQYLSADAVLADLPAASKYEALRHMLGVMHRLGYLTDVEHAERDVLTREAKMTTGIGHGIAVPHARTAAARGLHALLARRRDGLDWAALDGRPVHLIVLTLSPPDAPGPQLQLVAAIARLLHDGQVYERLMNAKTARAMFEIISPPKKRGFFRQ